MSAERPIIVGLGEVLWDLFPGRTQLGGAPTNFAYISSLLGEHAVVGSRVGNDALGREAKNSLQNLGLDTSYMQVDSSHPTGTVNVQVDRDGQPQFEIIQSVAWDYLEWTPAWQTLARQAHAVCFSSLAQRVHESRQTIQSFLHAVGPQTVRVFDVNLREAFYSREVVVESLHCSEVVKLNHEELPRVMQLLGLPYSDVRSAAERLRSEYELKLVSVTRGPNGSLLVAGNGHQEHPGFKVEVKDTVGAGDAFTAGLVYCYLRHTPLAVMNETANRLGAWVASQAGGTPAADAALLSQLRALVA
jgi:fructokinase